MAPAYAKLFLEDFERKALQNHPDKPHVWLRYIDQDILMVWTHGEETLDKFLKYPNKIHPIIKFTSGRSTTSIPFLDVNIQLHKGMTETDLSDKHQFLLHSSIASHPYHTKKSTVPVLQSSSSLTLHSRLHG